MMQLKIKRKKIFHRSLVIQVRLLMLDQLGGSDPPDPEHAKSVETIKRADHESCFIEFKQSIDSSRHLDFQPVSPEMSWHFLSASPSKSLAQIASEHTALTIN